MNKIANLERTFTCRAYSPQSRPSSANNSSTRIRNNITKLKLLKITNEQGYRSFDTSKISKQVKFIKNKKVCDVACSTRDHLTDNEKKEDLSKPVIKSLKSPELSFMKLNLPITQNEQTSIFSIRTSRKSQILKIPKSKLLIGLFYRESLISSKKTKSKKTL